MKAVFEYRKAVEKRASLGFLERLVTPDAVKADTKLFDPAVRDVTRNFRMSAVQQTTLEMIQQNAHNRMVLDRMKGELNAGAHSLTVDQIVEHVRGSEMTINFDASEFSQDQRPAIVGSPRYFESHAKPRSPRDLISQRCIKFRHGSAGVYRWEFQKGRKSLSVGVNGPLIVDDLELVTSAALDGVGLAYMSEEHGADHLASGALVRVLEDWCQPYPGFFLYYPSRRNQPAALAALIKTLRITE